ncbi:Trafficking protein particle complex subunit 31 [Naganishia albida]|nr:Trafficking protein particle complex subunit 31 [Naganishia albida]
MSRLSMFGGNADASKPPAAASSSSSSRFSVPTITSPSSSSTSSRAPVPPAKQRQSSYIASQLTNLSISGAPSAPPPLTSIVDRPVNRMRGAEVGMAAWAFLYSGIVAYSQSRVDSVVELEKRLASLGREAGQRIIALQMLRNAQTANLKDPKCEHRLIPILQYIHTQIYRYCFGKAADGLEKSVDGDDEYMLTSNQPPLTQHISIPRDLSQLSCEAYTAGLVEGVLDGLEVPARVTAHTVPTDQYPNRTVILIKLDQVVMDREAGLGK